MDQDKPIVCTSDRVRPANSEVMKLECDWNKAREILHWSPEVTLDEGLKRTIAWMTDHQGLFKTDAYVV